MAFIEDVATRNQYVAAAGQTIFDYDFPIFDQADIQVQVNGVLQAIGTNYTVSGVEAQNGGAITLIIAATLGDIITLERDVKKKRITDYSTRGSFRAKTVNLEFDRIVQMIQDEARKLTGTVRAPSSDQNYPLVDMPDETDREGNMLSFADGTSQPLAFLSAALVQSLITTGLTSLVPDPTVLVASVAALRLLDVSGLVGGEIAKTLGYYTGNNGEGFAEYDFVAGNTDADDGITIFAPDGGAAGRWKLRFHGSVFLDQAGGKHSDIAFDNGPVISALVVLDNVNEVLLGSGVYTQLTDVVYTSSDADKKRLSYTGIPGKSGWELRGGVKFEINKSNQEQLIIQGIEFSNGDADNANALNMFGAKTTIRDNTFLNFDIGLFVSTFYQRIENNLFKGGRIGIETRSTVGYSTNEIIGNFFTGQSEGGINITGVGNARSNNRIAGNKWEVIAAGGYGINLLNATDTHIDTPYMESVGGGTGNNIICTDCNNILVTAPRSTPPDLTLKAIRSTVTFSGGGTISGINATDNTTVLLYGPYEAITPISYAHDTTSFIKSFDNTENLTGRFLAPGLSRIAPGVTIVRNGAGDYTVTYVVARETNRTCVLVVPDTGSKTKIRSAQVYGTSAAGFSIICVDPTTGTPADPDGFSYFIQDIRSTQI